MSRRSFFCWAPFTNRVKFGILSFVKLQGADWEIIMIKKTIGILSLICAVLLLLSSCSEEIN